MLLLAQMDKKFDSLEHRKLLTCSHMPGSRVYPESVESNHILFL
jgi:hypothetical protein